MQWHKGEALRLSFFQSLIFLWCFMDNNKRVPLILFSGGLDSTYLLQKKMEEGDVEVLYVKGVLHDRKMKMEEERREKIIEFLEKKTGNKVRRQHRIDLGIMPFGNMEDQAFTQPPMWIMGALMVSDFNRHTQLLIGYVSGDQIMPVIAHIQAVWDQLQHICKRSDNIAVDFPLRFDSKLHILNAIYPELMRLVWWCETPNIKYYSLGPKLEHGPDETEEARQKRYAAMKEKIRMAATFFSWKRDREYPYWKRMLREIRATNYQKRIHSDDFTIDTNQLVEVETST
jgi:hypothetical protein